MSQDQCPEFLRPRLRLFISADIVGSTALKQSRGPIDTSDIKKHYAWFSAIQGFYVVSRNAFITRWRETEAQWPDDEDCFGDEPKLWKTIGDEVIFEKTLTDHRQLAVTLQCWISAVEEMRAFVKGQNPSLDIKCSAWLAGFPVRNKEVVISYTDEPSDPDDYYKASGLLLNQHYEDPTSSDLAIDYVGPSIDIGFRVGSQSTPRKFVLSVGIPYILALTSPTQSKLIGDFPIFYDGSKPLKGVLGGVSYPIFWIDMSENHSVAYHEDRLTGSKAAARDDIRRFCDAFYDENSVYTHRPFITAPDEQQISLKPLWWDELHGNLVKNFYLPDASSGLEPPGVALETDKPIGDDLWPTVLKTFLAAVRSAQENRESEKDGGDE